MFGRALLGCSFALAVGCGGSAHGEATAGAGGLVAAGGGATSAFGSGGTSMFGSGGSGALGSGGTPDSGFGGALNGGFEIEIPAPAPVVSSGQRIIPSCDADSDSDGDHINDFYEGRIEVTPEQSPDADGDGIPNYLDSNSDGEGLPDIEQAGSDPCARPPDTDFDDVPDFLDIDNDGDGLSDGLELALQTDPFDYDSDDNGCVDAVDALESKCDPRAHGSVLVPCDARVIESRLELRVSDSFPGELSDVSVRVDYDPRLIHAATVLLVRVGPPEDAASASVYDGMLQTVRAGAVLPVGVIVSPPIANLFLSLSVHSESYGELARGSLAVIFRGPRCPAPG